MGVGVIGQVESVRDPVLKDASAGGSIWFLFYGFLDYETGYWDVVFCECRQEAVVNFVGGIVGEI